MLRRMVALLVALAGLAEQAAGRSFPVRFLVLLVLRWAETVARGYVAEALLVDTICYDDGGDGASGPADAAALALRFRALAAAVATLLPPDDVRFVPRGGRIVAPRRRGFFAAVGRVALRVASPRPHDTS